MPIAVPSVVMGVGILYWYLAAPLPFHLYGTLAILVIAFVTIGLPYGHALHRARHGADQGRAGGGGDRQRRRAGSQTFRRIYVPLLMPSLLAAFLYTMIVAFREISAAIFLYTPGTEVVSVQIYDLWSNGSYPVVAALGVVIVALPQP